MKFKITETLQKFPGNYGWFYVPVPKKHSFKKQKKTRWGFIPIRASVGDTSWKTSLLPMGNGIYFVALKALVREKEHILKGDVI